MEYKKKLIEVALPLQAINEACVREKSIRHGHLSTLHLYWARRPLAAARAIIFASLIDDPSNNKNYNSEKIYKERKRLFNLLQQLIKWENTNNKQILKEAHEEILKSTQGIIPNFIDPFCGGGSIPIEAQRLGLNTYASDLNPLSVIITKSLVELPLEFKGKKPICEITNRLDFGEEGYNGIALDLQFYGEIVNNSVKELIGNYFPKSLNGNDIIIWNWVRRVECPNPGCNCRTPLLKSLELGKSVDGIVSLIPKIIFSDETPTILFEIAYNKQKNSGNITGGNGYCLNCKQPISRNYLCEQGEKGEIDYQLTHFISLENGKKKFYSPNDEQINIAENVKKPNIDDIDLEPGANFRVANYGYNTFSSLFTNRQLLVFETYKKVIKEIDLRIIKDGGSNEYASLLKTYFAFALNKLVDYNSTISTWNKARSSIRSTFSRQALSLSWDFTEINPFTRSTGSFLSGLKWIIKIMETHQALGNGKVIQHDASKDISFIENPLVSTDPPYYDNIYYADLSDFFYYYLRQILGKDYDHSFSTIKTPKKPEIIANYYLANKNKKKAEQNFLNGMIKSARNISKIANDQFPVTYYYAYKQTEKNIRGDVSSTGWETFLEGLIQAGYMITATWPLRTERTGRMISIGTNALASSVVVALRKKPTSIPIATRNEFVRTLSEKLESDIINMMSYDISPVDLQQSAIGPGMAVFTQYSKVLEADGSPMSVKTAMQLINAELDRIQENSDIEMDSDTRFCIQWFDTYGFEEKSYGEAETLAQAKDISVQGLVNSGVFEADSGKAKLKHWSKMPTDWDPRTDKRLTLWECTHHMVRELVNGDGQLGAAKLAKFMGPQKADEAKELAYQLFHICDKKSWAKHAGDYNTLVSNWADIKSQISNVGDEQATLF